MSATPHLWLQDLPIWPELAAWSVRRQAFPVQHRPHIRWTVSGRIPGVVTEGLVWCLRTLVVLVAVKTIPFREIFLLPWILGQQRLCWTSDS